MSSLTKAERDKLPDSEFGLPKKRMFPLHDKKHVLMAIKMFKYCPLEDRPELARNIEKKAIKFKIKIGKSTLVAKYLHKNSVVLVEDKTCPVWQDNSTAYNPKIDEIINEINKLLKEKKIWISSDYHVNNSDDLSKMIKSHNNCVTNNDCFIFLGDMVSDEYNGFLQDVGYKEIAKLNGKRKIMIKGNNDLLDNNFYLTQCKFDYIFDAFRYQNILFTHVPLDDDIIQANEINVCGHLHNASLVKSEYNPKNHLKVYTGADTNYKPRDFKLILKKFIRQSHIIEGIDLFNEMMYYSEMSGLDIIDDKNLDIDRVINSINENYKMKFQLAEAYDESEFKNKLINEIDTVLKRVSNIYYLNEDLKEKVLKTLYLIKKSNKD